jgi:metallophosphoesterase superfamily enzyme
VTVTPSASSALLARVAVVSDMHCHLVSQPRESFLTVGSLRRLRNQHPVEGLLELVKTDPLASSADVLVMPGDFASRMSQEGLSQAWAYVVEIAQALGASHLVPTIGNHDVDAHRILSYPNPFHVTQHLHPAFPFPTQALCEQFFSSGYCVVPTPLDVDFVVLNTVVDHHDKTSAKRGTFSVERIEHLRHTLPTASSASNKIALMHHHPVLHSSRFIGSADVIETGDLLLDVLAANGITLVIHGHKHHPRLRYVDTAHGRIAVFASGSFAAILADMAMETRNTFHIIDVIASGAGGSKGTIRTWEWKAGWVRAEASSCGFPFRSGFSPTGSPVDTRALLVALAAQYPDVARFDEPVLIAHVPALQFSTPTELEQMEKALLDSHGLELRQLRDGTLELGRRIKGKTP